MTTNDFIERSNLKHGNRYEYNHILVDEILSTDRVDILCRDHGMFTQLAYKHYGGSNCPECNNNRKSISVGDFIERSNIIHDNKYDYSKSKFEKLSDSIEIICPKHGSFNQIVNNHLNKKYGCRECGYDNIRSNVPKKEKSDVVRNTTDFIEKSKKIHGDRYDYSESEYTLSRNKIKIICDTHGEFKQISSNHLSGSGCPICSISSRRISDDDILSYIQENTNYEFIKRDGDYIKLTCEIHGIFSIHINKFRNRGCQKCSILDKRDDIGTFISKSVNIHGDIYDYSMTEYVDNRTMVDIICEKHGIFQQLPSSHKSGRGCPSCSSSRGEKSIGDYLSDNNIEFIKEKKFEDCKYLNLLRFDFYIPEYEILIEFDGIQHFEPVEYFGGTQSYINRVERDTIKNEYCLDNNIHLIRIPYWEFDNISEILNDKIINNNVFK